MLTVDTRNLPEALKRNGVFCLWRYEEVDGRKTKVPYNPRNKTQRAASDNKNTFAPLDVAVKAYDDSFSGLGVGIFDSVGAIDIDHCMVRELADPDIPESAMIIPNAAAHDIISIMDAYTEISPSGEGIRILFSVPPGFTYDTGKYYINNQKAGIEIYLPGMTRKYVTVTGDEINNFNTEPVDLIDRSDRIQQILDKYMKRDSTGTSAPAEPRQNAKTAAYQQTELSDNELIDKAMNAGNGAKFSALWNGDISGYNSQSEADIALCILLAYWTNNDEARIDSLFRSSGLFRKKWDRRQSGSTYGKITISNAIRKNEEAETARTPVVTSQKNDLANDTAKEASKPEDAKLNEQKQDEYKKPRSFLELLNSDVQLPLFIVKDMIPEGLTFLAAPMKTGKSWAAADLCFSVAQGKPFLGYETLKSDTLYLDYEGSEGSIKQRLLIEQKHTGIPGNAYFKTIDDIAGDGAPPRIGSGFEQFIEEEILHNEKLKLIIIDTYQFVVPARKRTESQYEADYNNAKALQRIGVKYHVAIVCIHHTTQMKHPEDVFSEITGTTGLTGAADANIVIAKDKREDANAVWAVTGRHARELNLNVSLDRDLLTWISHGETTPEAVKEERAEAEEYRQSAIREAVIMIAEGLKETTTFKAAQIREKALNMDFPLTASAKQIGGFMYHHWGRFYTEDGVKIYSEPDGNAGRKWIIVPRWKKLREAAELTELDAEEIMNPFDDTEGVNG